MARRNDGRNITNRWTGATGSDFRIKLDPAKLLGSAVARSTQPLDCLFLNELKLITGPHLTFSQNRKIEAAAFTH